VFLLEDSSRLHLASLSATRSFAYMCAVVYRLLLVSVSRVVCGSATGEA